MGKRLASLSFQEFTDLLIEAWIVLTNMTIKSF